MPMGKVYAVIDDRLKEFIEAQRIFFVATAPSGPGGHVNLSPKGLDAFRILDDRTVAYLDFIGSGAETIAHLRDNGRIVLMFCAFEGPPKIVRLHGRGEAIEPTDPRFLGLAALFPPSVMLRSVIHLNVQRVSDSCGYSVPFYRYEGERSTLSDWAEKKGPEKLLDYQRQKNARSIDGLPALRWVEEETS
jgi:Pyridoxamine 5'-phosphate oxidase